MLGHKIYLGRHVTGARFGKCLCGAELDGEDEIRAHVQLLEAELEVAAAFDVPVRMLRWTT